MQFVEAERERFSVDGKPPIEWDRYLEVAPALATLDPAERDDALAERGVDAGTWTQAERYWLLTFALDLHHGRTERADAFGRACAEAHTAERDIPPQPEAPLEPTPLPALAPSVVESPAPAAPVVPVLPAVAPVLGASQSAAPVPTFLRAREQAPAPVAPSLSVTPPHALVPAPPAISLAVVRQAPASAEPPPLRGFVETQAVDIAAIARGAFPPGPARPGSAPALPPSGPATKAPAEAWRGMTLDPVDIAPAAALPFGHTPSPEHAARLAALPSPQPRPSAHRPDATVSPGAMSVGPSTPFVGPGATQQPPKIPELTVAQYAMLGAELAADADGKRRAEILARYRVESPEALSRLDFEWQARLRADARIANQWKVAYAQHRSTLEQTRRR